MSNGTKLKIFLGALAIANVVVSLMAAPAHAYQCKGGFTTAAAVGSAEIPQPPGGAKAAKKDGGRSFALSGALLENRTN